VFSQFGIAPMDSVGKKFDPRFHEAIAEEEKTDCEPLTVIREHRKGYTLHDRLLRAAQVIVVKRKDQG
jgi:molecular chaperone GrpE